MNEAQRWMDDQPLLSAVRNAVTTFFSCWWIYITLYHPWSRRRRAIAGESFFRAPWFVWPLSVLVTGPLFGIEQGYGCHFLFRSGWPKWPMRAADWHNNIALWVERQVEWWVWLPPDSGDPKEIGIHALRSEITYGERDPETFERPILGRPRCFQYATPAIAGPGTYGSGMTTFYRWEGVLPPNPTGGRAA